VKKSFEGTKELVGEIKCRILRIKFIEDKKENYIKIITIM